MGYKNGHVASNRFRQIKKKLGWRVGVRVNKGITPTKSNVARARYKAKPLASTIKKPAAKKAAPTAKGRAPAKKLRKYVEEVDDEEEKPRNLMAPSDDEDGQWEKARELMAPSDSDADQEEMSMQAKVARGDFDSHSFWDGKLSAGELDRISRELAEKKLQKQIAQESGTGGEPVYEEYYAYGADEVSEDAQDQGKYEKPVPTCT